MFARMILTPPLVGNFMVRWDVDTTVLKELREGGPAKNSVVGHRVGDDHEVDSLCCGGRGCSRTHRV